MDLHEGDVVASCTEHNIWANMLRRCYQKKNKRYDDYGGRGIRVAARWLDFFSFVEDMGRRPDGLSLDRIDNNGHYEPSNCRWATTDQQANNKRTTRHIEIGGVTKTFIEWCRHFGCGRNRVRQRYDRCGDWQEAFEGTMAAKEIQISKPFTINGVTKTLSEWCREHGVTTKVVRQRMTRDGKTLVDALKWDAFDFASEAMKKEPGYSTVTTPSNPSSVRSQCLAREP